MKSIQEINCKDWNDFDKKISKFPQPKDFIYRGQGNSDWKLESSFQRFYKSYFKSIPSISEEDPFNILIKKYISCFGNQDKAYEKFEINDYVNMGQHFGLPTPYLDWTRTIHKAVFFACCDEAIAPGLHDTVSVFALQVKNIDKLTSKPMMQKHVIDNGGITLFEKDGFKIESPIKSSQNTRIDA